VNHQCTNIDAIPDSMFSIVRDKLKIRYGHRSHGNQLSVGLDSLSLINSDKYKKFSISQPWQTSSETWFEGGTNATREYLKSHSEINVFMFMWCSELALGLYSQERVAAYLDSLSALENEFPDVAFVYMTSNAQWYSNEEEVLNRQNRDQQIREYCIENNKILYDFEDLDTWWFNPDSKEWEDSTITVKGQTVNMLHRMYNEEVLEHTTIENCLNKGKAFWWLCAQICGWNSDGIEGIPVIIQNKRTGFFIQKNDNTYSIDLLGRKFEIVSNRQVASFLSLRKNNSSIFLFR
jgi:hypothetical protein